MRNTKNARVGRLVLEYLRERDDRRVRGMENVRVSKIVVEYLRERGNRRRKA